MEHLNDIAVIPQSKAFFDSEAFFDRLVRSTHFTFQYADDEILSLNNVRVRSIQNQPTSPTPFPRAVLRLTKRTPQSRRRQTVRKGQTAKRPSRWEHLQPNGHLFSLKLKCRSIPWSIRAARGGRDHKTDDPSECPFISSPHRSARYVLHILRNSIRTSEALDSGSLVPTLAF